jgi:hypothetical protein
MKQKFVVTILATLVSVTVQANLIASYGFNDVATSFDTETNTTANSFTVGAGVTSFGYSATRQEGVKSAYFYNSKFYSANKADAVTASDYVTFTIDVNSGKSVSFTNLSFYSLRNFTTGVGAPDQFAIRTSQDNYAADVSAGTMAITAQATNYVFSLNTLALSGVSNLQSVTNSTQFRIYMWVSSGSIDVVANRTLYLDNLTVEGTVTTIPEPATIGMLGLGALVTLMVRRMRTKN